MSEPESAWIGDPHALQVIVTTALLGASAGAIGTMLTLKSRALVGDAAGHATLPGLAGASLASIALGGTGRELWVLMPGAIAGACAGMASVAALQRALKMSADAAMAVTLGTLFGLGVALLSVVQQAPGGHQAGLDGLLVGRAATLVAADLAAAAALAALTLALFIALGRDLRALAFDEQFARMVGRPAGLVSALVAAVIVCSIVAGTHAVGLVLVVALLVMPATAARMISDRYTTVVAAAACIGAIGAASGTAASAMLPGLATGPLIVIACAALLAAAVILRRLRRAVGSAS